MRRQKKSVTHVALEQLSGLTRIRQPSQMSTPAFLEAETNLKRNSLLLSSHTDTPRTVLLIPSFYLKLRSSAKKRTAIWTNWKDLKQTLFSLEWSTTTTRMQLEQLIYGVLS